MKSDQRLFFRIDVMMPCSYRILSAEEAGKMPLSDMPDSQYIEEYFMQNLKQLDEQINDVIAEINQKSSLLASALTAMNSKVNFMMRTIDPQQLSRAIPQRLVNLSAGGISFVLQEKVDLSNKIDLLIQPLENEPPVLVRCNVVKVIPQANEQGSRIALEYQNMSEDDRRKLVYFIQSKEIELANKEREKEREKERGKSKK